MDTFIALVPEGGEAASDESPPPVLMSYGRNRQGEGDFLAACDGLTSGKARTLTMTDVGESELDELYQCSDVRVVNCGDALMTSVVVDGRNDIQVLVTLKLD